MLWNPLQNITNKVALWIDHNDPSTSVHVGGNKVEHDRRFTSPSWPEQVEMPECILNW
jgi:hypothetical protein